MNLDKLYGVGLNENESKLYVSLLKLTESSVTQLSKESGINRSLLYFILHDLEQRGFVSHILKNNVRFYRAVNPNKVLDLLHEKEKGFKSILPELLELNKFSKKKPQVEILEGKEGIKTILNEILRLKKDWFAFNIPGKGPEVLGDWVYAYERERQRVGIKLNVILVGTEQGVIRGKEFSKMKFTKVKYLGKNYESPASSYIYGDRLVIIFWYKEFPFAIRIVDKSLADSYKKYFDEMWKIAKI